MSDDRYTEQQARLDVFEFLAKNPNALNLGKSELIAEIESSMKSIRNWKLTRIMQGE